MLNRQNQGLRRNQGIRRVDMVKADLVMEAGSGI